MPHLFSKLLFFLLVILPVYASGAERVALVVGVGSYNHLVSLENPVRDAVAIAAILRESGFAVTEKHDMTKREFEAALDEFQASTKDATEAIVYFAGHGMAVIEDDQLVNIIAPSDVDISCENRKATNALAMSRLFDATAHVPNRIFLFDACRNNPFVDCPETATTASSGFGYRSVEPEVIKVAAPADAGVDPNKLSGATRTLAETAAARTAGALIAFSTDVNGLALDGEPGENSPFAAALLEELQGNPNTPIRELLDQASATVARQTNFFQVPWVLTKGGEPRICLSGRCEGRAEIDRGRSFERARAINHLALQHMEKGDAVSAALLALETLPQSDLSETPIYPDALPTLRKALAEQKEQAILVHDGTVKHIEITPDGETTATATNDGTVHVWEVATKALKWRWKFGLDPAVSERFSVDQIAISPDGRRLAVRSERDDTVWWAYVNGRSQVVHRGTKKPQIDDAYSISEFVNEVRIFDLASGQILATVGSGQERTTAVGWLNRSDGFVAGMSDPGEDKQWFTVFNTTGRKVETREFAERLWAFGSIFVSPDDRYIIGQSLEHSASVDRKTGHAAVLMTGSGGMGGSIVHHAVAFGDSYAVVADESVYVADLRKGIRIRDLVDLDGEPIDETIYLGVSDSGLTVLQIGYTVFGGAGSKGHAIVWNTKDWSVRSRFEVPDAQFTDAYLLPNGDDAVTASTDGTIRFWRLKDGRQTDVFHWGNNQTEPAKIAVSHDGSRLVSGQGDRNAVQIWQTAIAGQTDASELVLDTPETRELPPNTYNGLGRVFPEPVTIAFDQESGDLASIWRSFGYPDQDLLVFDGSTGGKILEEPVRGQTVGYPLIEWVGEAIWIGDYQGKHLQYFCLPASDVCSEPQQRPSWAKSGVDPAQRRHYDPQTKLSDGYTVSYFPKTPKSDDSRIEITHDDGGSIRIPVEEITARMSGISRFVNRVLNDAKVVGSRLHVFWGELVIVPDATLDSYEVYDPVSYDNELAQARKSEAFVSAEISGNGAFAAFQVFVHEARPGEQAQSILVWDVAKAEVASRIPVFASDIAISRDGSLLVTALPRGEVRIFLTATAQQVHEVQGGQRARFTPQGDLLVYGGVRKNGVDHDTNLMKLVDLSAFAPPSVEQAQERLPRCLTLDQRREMFLDPVVPAWCRELAKWPFDGASEKFAGRLR